MEDSAQCLEFVYDKKIVAINENDDKNNIKWSNFQDMFLGLPW